jgi:hypothetical protein
MSRLQDLVDDALTRARTAETDVHVVHGRCAHVVWEELVAAARREFEAVQRLGCTRLSYNSARAIVRLLVETAAASSAKDSRSSGSDALEEVVSIGYIEWVCAAVNSAVVGWAAVSRLLARFESVIPDPYRTQLDADSVKVAFADMGQAGIDWLVTAVVRDLQTVLGKISSRRSTQAAQEGQAEGEGEEEGRSMVMAAVVATIADYFDDFSRLLLREHVATVAEGVATGLACLYIEALLREGSRGDRWDSDTPAEELDAAAARTAEAVEGDVLLVTSVLSPHLSTPRLDSALEPLCSVAALLMAPVVPAEQFALAFERLCRRHWGRVGVSFSLAERVLDLRCVSDGVLSRAKTNARSACEERLAGLWNAAELVAPVAQPAQRVQDTSKRRRINRQRRGCDTFCNTCAGPASIASAASPQLGAYPPTAFELLCGELGTAEIRTFAELQLFREQVALETAVLSLAEARREVHALEQEAEECAAARDMFSAEFEDITLELAALSAREATPPLPAIGGAAVEAAGRDGAADTETEIAGDDI